MPKGVLLEGPPGVGKTLIARAMAGESKCDFKYISASELIGFYNGQGAENVSNLFKTLRESGKMTILFIDEFDSIGGKRNSFFSSNSNWVINNLLTEMDGFLKKDKILVIASTNFAEKLDPAVTRAGRFDRVVSIPYPAMDGRAQILKYYIQKVCLICCPY